MGGDRMATVGQATGGTTTGKARIYKKKIGDRLRVMDYE